jgi:hypothetical protein
MNYALPSSIINEMTDTFTIEREGVSVGSVHGFFCGSKYPSTIQLVESSSIQNGDWLIHAITQNRYFVEDVQPISVHGQIIDWMVRYKTSSEIERQTSSSAIINIGTISGPSIIGSQQNATLNVGTSIEDIAKIVATMPAADMVELCDLISELKKIERSDEPIKKGQLSKFSDALQKHSDLLIALGGWAVKLLTGN